MGPTYLSNNDRSRLVEINDILLTSLTGQEAQDYEKERREILSRSKPIPECTYDELMELKQQLYDEYQKHAVINSSQIVTIVNFIRTVELRMNAILSKQVAEPEKTEIPDEKTRPNKVSSKPSSFSWAIGIDDDN